MGCYPSFFSEKEAAAYLSVSLSTQTALAPDKRGPKPARNLLVEEMEKLRRENTRLAQQLEKAEIIIDVQNKVSYLQGIRLKDSNSGEINS